MTTVMFLFPHSGLHRFRFRSITVVDVIFFSKTQEQITLGVLENFKAVEYDLREICHFQKAERTRRKLYFYLLLNFKGEEKIVTFRVRFGHQKAEESYSSVYPPLRIMVTVRLFCDSQFCYSEYSLLLYFSCQFNTLSLSNTYYLAMQVTAYNRNVT